MANNKIVRTVCYFTDSPGEETINKIEAISHRLSDIGYILQTKRVCSANFELIRLLDEKYVKKGYVFSLGTLAQNELEKGLKAVYENNNTSFNYDLSNKEITYDDVNILLAIIKTNPSKTFNFTYVFNNRSSSPYFPSASYEKNGFSIGLQPTDLSENCKSVDEWLNSMKEVWRELNSLFKEDGEFLGIDSSIAPLMSGNSSLIHFINRLGIDFSKSTTSDIYLQITKFIKGENPNPVGLCGLMLPCLEDFELAAEYDSGNFSVERNIYLSLHSGLGVDTYPLGIDEKPERIIEILRLIQGLSNKYHKPLSCRFVSDGKAKVGDKSDFKNQYLKDVTIRPL